MGMLSALIPTEALALPPKLTKAAVWSKNPVQGLCSERSSGVGITIIFCILRP